MSFQAPTLVAQRASVPNFSRVIQGRLHNTLAKQPRRNHSLGEISAFVQPRTADIKRWDPRSQNSSSWDGLRRDDELWSQDGDCFVHLYGKGRSRRGPSFCLIRTDLDTVRRDLSTSDLLNFSEGSSDVYVAAPENAMREEVFKWHLTTRNFFAWITRKPLVGVTLGEALIDLLARMRLFRPYADNTGDLLSYLNTLGYTDFSQSPDRALALLRFAEHYQLKDLWTEAFSHCVGMNERLCSSLEFDAISRVTKALITRSYLEMDLHLGRVSRALKTFLEEELSPANFGLSDGAQDHLERFRSFLHSFYVNQFGYWPPEENYCFSKSLLQSMYDEFDALYDFLADRTSSVNLGAQATPASGGLCVVQNVVAFNQRHSYKPLPYSSPMIPQCHKPSGKTQSQRGLRSFRLGTKQPSMSKFEEGMSMRSALVMATNSADSDVLEHPLIKAYVRFEQEWSIKPKEKVSVADARKVRWIVIYAMLQMLTSVVHAPKEVKNPDLASYHMCLLTTGTPSWGQGVQASAPSTTAARPEISLDDTNTSRGIQPDCEIFASLPKRSASNASLRPAPLRINSAIVSRTSSFKSMFTQSQPRSRNSTISTTPSQSPIVPTTEVEEPEQGSQTPPLLDLDMLSLHPASSDASPSSPTFSASSSVYSTDQSWQLDDADTFSWSSVEEWRSSKGIYNMEHESVYSSGCGSTGKSNTVASTPCTPSPTSRTASGLFSSMSSVSPQAGPGKANLDSELGYFDYALREDECGDVAERLDAPFDFYQALEFLPH